MALLVSVSVGDAGKQGIILKFNVISQSIVRENISTSTHILYKCCVVKDVPSLAAHPIFCLVGKALAGLRCFPGLAGLNFLG